MADRPDALPLGGVMRYHERTKHHLDRSARSLGYLDWANQPDPFRRFAGAPLLPLDHPPLSAQPTYDAVVLGQLPPAAPLDRSAVSRLFYDSLALSAWKQAPGSGRWSLRINPSSGALHPTEGYLIAGPIPGLSAEAAVYHYSPYRHGLEQRLVLSDVEWSGLSAELPPGAVLVGFTSIYWRESWKYGERAYRYCQHDLGHAVAAVALSAATLGWRTRLVSTLGDDELGSLLGTERQEGPEAEHPDCLLAVSPREASLNDGQPPAVRVAQSLRDRLVAAAWLGEPNRLSDEHQPWEVIDEVAAAAEFRGQPVEAHGSGSRDAGEPRDFGGSRPERCGLTRSPSPLPDRGLPAQQIIRQRRSAVDMDGRTSLSREAFEHLLGRLIPHGNWPFDVLPWRPAVSLAIFVHRVDDLPPGLYLLVRDPAHEASLRASLSADFGWQRPARCPAGLELWCLVEADCRQAARVISCQQAIAADGAFSLGMLADFEGQLRQHGAWFYPRLFWETGLIGQALYLEAEAAGVRGTGIGCFFDDALHQVLGIEERTWQSLYHFTVGGAVDDLRLQILPPYAHLERD